MRIKKLKKYLVVGFALVLLPFSGAYSQGQLCQLPNWFFNTSNYNSNSLAIGISDPGMDKNRAYKQAKIRALLNHALLHNANFSALMTSGVGNQNNEASTTSLEFVLYSSIIKGKLASTKNTQVIDSFYTQNNEAIVLVEIGPYKEAQTISSFTISRRAGFQKENSAAPLFADELDIEITINDTVYHSLLSKNSNRIIKSSNSFLYKNMHLVQYQDVNKNNNKTLPSLLTNGLWNAYIFNLVDQICLYNSFRTDFHHKLSSSELGTISNAVKTETFQQFVSSLKNVQSRDITTEVKNIGVSKNQLLIFAKQQGQEYDFSQNTVAKLNKKDRKELKKLREENWQYIGSQQIENAWFEAKNKIGTLSNFAIAGKEIHANNLNSGIIEAVQLAKLELSSQLSAKISALTNSELQGDVSNHMQSAKLMNITKTKQIRPFYIFYRKINANAYQVKVLLFYELNDDI